LNGKRGRSKIFAKSTGPIYQVQVLEAVGGLGSWPECGNVKRLTNHKHNYRLRVGRYRVFFNVHEQIEIVMVEEVKKTR
jgi:mRNA-degrading endonuclease RelE of RelBE toxin-antitoxin system